MEFGDTRHILLIEDQDADVRLVRAALGGWGGPVDLHVVKSASDAMEQLLGDGLRGDGTLPNLILLDLAMPGMDGMTFLQKMRSDERLACIPVLILTGNEDPDAVRAAYAAGAQAYVVKPFDLADFIEVLHKTLVFWTEIAELPEVE